MRRIIHLPGGLRLINRIGRDVVLDAGAGAGEQVVFRLGAFHNLYADAARLGLLPVGFESVETRDQQDGHDPTSFHVLDLTRRPPWACRAQGDQWQCLAHAAQLAGERVLQDIASRISHELRGCDELLFALSSAYGAELRSALRDGKTANTRFTSGHTTRIHQAFETFLTRAAVLRDHLAEFYAWTWAGLGTAPTAHPVTSISGLLGALKKHPRADLLATELAAITADGGWLQVFGAYRNLVIHGASISRADGTLTAVVVQTRLENGMTPLRIKVPLPDDPGGISAQRTSGDYHKDPARTPGALSHAVANVDTARDMLDYAADCLRKLAGLAETALALSPVKPVMPEITEANIIDITVGQAVPPR